MKRAYHFLAVEPRCLAQQAAAASWTAVAIERFPTVAFAIKGGRGSIHCLSELISAISVGESAHSERRKLALSTAVDKLVCNSSEKSRALIPRTCKGGRVSQEDFDGSIMAKGQRQIA